MFRRHQGRRSTNPVFVLFRLLLSLVMFVALLGGVYSAYKHFSGLDPLKLDPQSVATNLLHGKIPPQLLTLLSNTKLPTKIVSQPASPNLAFKFMLVADSEGDNDNLAKALGQVKQNNLSFIIGLGDYTQVGTIDQLISSKKQFDLAGIRYFLVPGDHDLWDSRDKGKEAGANFTQVFGPTYQSFSYQGYLFLLLDNSDDYLGFSSLQLEWSSRELEKGKSGEVKGIFVFIPIPLYHPSSDHFMGKVEPKLKQQAQGMILQLKQANVKKVFSGDIHYFSEYEEPITKLSMMTVGAVATDRNPQAPRFAIVSVFEDGSTKVEDVEIRTP